MASDTKKIVNKITNDIINDIKETNAKITEKALKNKIDVKIKQIIEQKRLRDEIKKQEQLEKEEQFIKNEFTNITDEDEEITNNNVKKNSNEDIFEEKINENVDKTQENNIERTKQSFILEISQLYKQEYEKSINGFKNFLNSFQFIKNASLFEKILLSLFIIIPALLSGFIGIILLAIILIFWQIAIIIKILLNILKSIEKFFHNNIIKLQSIITSFKNSGSIFKKLILSNLLYSVVFINGMFYLFMKGMVFPITSLDTINKILGNLVCKTTRGLSNILRSPSDLALSNMKVSGLVASKPEKSLNYSKNSTKAKGYTGISSNIFTKKQLKNRANKIALKTTRKGKNLSLDGRYISENIFENKKEDNKNEDDIDKNMSNEDKLRNLVIDTENQRDPLSYNLSDRALENDFFLHLTNDIFNNIKENFSDIMDLPMPDKMPAINHDRSHMQKINNDLKTETQEKVDGITNAQDNLNMLGYQDPISLSSQYKEMRDNGVEYPTAETLKTQNKNWEMLSQDDKIRAAINVGDIRAGQEDLRDLKYYNDWTKNEAKDISYESYLSAKLANAERDCQQESNEFKERYGYNCEDLITQGMKEHNIPIGKTMNDKEFEKVAISIVKKFPEEKQMDMAKDLREYSLTYSEMQNCKYDLQEERQKSLTNNKNTEKQEKEEVSSKISHSITNFVDIVEKKQKPIKITNMLDMQSKQETKRDSGRNI